MLPFRLHVQHFMAHGRSRVAQQLLAAGPAGAAGAAGAAQAAGAAGAAGAAASPLWDEQQPPDSPASNDGEGGVRASVRHSLMLLVMAIGVVGGFLCLAALCGAPSRCMREHLAVHLFSMGWTVTGNVRGRCERFKPK